jgi:hypothetical protein
MTGMPRRFASEEGGWLRWTGEPGHLGTIRVRAKQSDDGRWHLTALWLDGSVSAEALRAVPVGRIEAALNSQLHAQAPSGRARSVRSARVPDRLRSTAVSGYPDAFYESVANIYRSLVATSSSPVAALAEANNVPLSTAQRWVKEARRRALLPPGRPGKAG